MSQLPVPYLTKYFADAAYLEKQKYVFEEALNDTSRKCKKAHDNKNYYTKLKANLEGSLPELNTTYEQKRQELESGKEACNYTKNKFVFIRAISFIIMIIFGAIATVLMGTLIISGEDINVESPTFMLGTLCTYITVAAVVFFIIGSIKSKNAKRFIEDANNRSLDSEKALERNELLARIVQCQQNIEHFTCTENSLVSAYAEFKKSYNTVTRALNALYAKNVVAPIYRNFTAMATFHHYLVTQRCTYFAGPGGLVDTYEKDLQFKKAYSLMSSIHDIVLDTSITMYEIKDEAVRTNNELRSIGNTLSSIESNNSRIASSNSEIAKYCADSNQKINAIYARY